VLQIASCIWLQTVYFHYSSAFSTATKSLRLAAPQWSCTVSHLVSVGSATAVIAATGIVVVVVIVVGHTGLCSGWWVGSCRRVMSAR
jgi:hypothetical protein